MILVDTSAWIEFFRDRGTLAAVVDDALGADQVAICGPVLTELRRGLSSASERRKVLPLLEGCHLLGQPQHLWEEAGELGFTLRSKGVTAKTLDLLIATYAMRHKVPVLARDSDFGHMREAGVALLLVEHE